MKKITLLFAIAMFSLIGNATVYVVPGGSGTADGSSWENAYGSIQTAINAGKSTCTATRTPQDVWVKAGTYSTSAAALIMKDSVSLYGGFIGTETDKSQRTKGTSAWDYTNATILDGGGVKRCVESGGGNYAYVTIVDGFTITNGAAQGVQTAGVGGGAFLRHNLKLQNCIVTGNTATGNGGGVNMLGGIISNCWIYNNTGSAGGAFYSNPGAGTSTNIDNCLIERNSATSGGGFRAQGSVANSNNIDRCIIRNNTTSANGAGIYVQGSTSASITNCLVTNNTGSNAVYLVGAKLINSIVANNEGGVYLATASSGELYNNIIVNNVTKGTTTALGVSAVAGYATGKVKNNAIWPSVAFQTWGDATDSILTVDAENALTQVSFKSPTSFRGRVLANADSLNLIASADWTLTASSICLEKGDNTFLPTGIVKDLAGNTRIENTNVDLGAYELPNSITTGLLNEISTVKCIGKINSIEIQGLTAGETASVYALTGSLVTQKKSNASTLTIDLPTGMYIVKVGEKVNKVIVK